MVVTHTTIIHDLEGVPKASELQYQGDGLDIYVHKESGVSLTPSRRAAIDNAALHLAVAFGVAPGCLRNVKKRPAKQRLDKQQQVANEKTERMF